MATNHRFSGWRVLAARDDDDIGAAQRGDWFAKAARRKQMASAKWICRIEQNNIDIARELEVLKTVVENETFDTGTFQFPALRKTIRANADGNSVTQTFMEKDSFVIPTGRNCDPGGDARTLRQRAIATRQHGNSFSRPGKALHKPNDHGSFSRAADGEIADADDDATQMALSENAGAVSPGTQTRTGAVENRKRPEK